MDTERFARIKSILLALRDLPRHDHAAYLDRVCGTDLDLRQNVLALFEEKTGRVIRTGGLEPLLGEALAEELARLAAGPHPEHIGPYRILGVLGRGGMGIVYRAEQEAPIRREVALKLVRRSFLDDQTVIRFQAEQQALALLEHPHIARVLDAGTDADGDSYFVMELVRGAAITEFCRLHELTRRERLVLFKKICLAVQHAHQRGIMHRDLKPSNILVSRMDGRDEPKIIDFGIAKSLEAPLVPVTSVTVEGQLLGTPEYMSPEQLCGEPTDVRTDIYSLGVILYELLTGTLPHDVRGKPPAEVVRVLADSPPRRLREAIPTRSWDPDLEVILQKAMAREPDRRYPSALDFARDVDRYLTARPIHARPPSTMYQFRKLVARHRIRFLLASALAASLIVFGITMSLLFAGQRRANKAARLEQAKTVEINAFLRNMFDSVSLDKEGWQVTVVDILERATTDVDTLRGRPEIYAELCDIIGNAYMSLEQYDRAETPFVNAMTVLESAVGPDHPKVSGLYTNLTALSFRRGDYIGAERYAHKALLYAVTGHGEMSEETGIALNNLAMIAANLGRQAEAESLYVRALLVRRIVLGPTDRRTLVTLSNLCHALRQAGRFREAETRFEESLALRRQVFDEGHPWVAGTQRDLAAVKMALGDYETAESLTRQALAAHMAQDGQSNKVSDLTVLATILRDTGRLDEAERIQLSGLDSLRTLFPFDHPEVARDMGGLARIRHKRGDLVRADAGYRSALEMLERLGLRDHPDSGMLLVCRAELLMDRGRSREAETLLQRALEIARNHHPDGHWQITCAEIALARCLSARGLEAEAQSILTGSNLDLRWQSDAERRGALTRLLPLFGRWGWDAQTAKVQMILHS